VPVLSVPFGDARGGNFPGKERKAGRDRQISASLFVGPVREQQPVCHGTVRGALFNHSGTLKISRAD